MRRPLLLALVLAAGACTDDAPPGPTLEGIDPPVDADLAPEGTLQPGAGLTPEATLTPDASAQPDSAALQPGQTPD